MGGSAKSEILLRVSLEGRNVNIKIQREWKYRHKEGREHEME
jgi:hypothetical protein